MSDFDGHPLPDIGEDNETADPKVLDNLIWLRTRASTAESHLDAVDAHLATLDAGVASAINAANVAAANAQSAAGQAAAAAQQAAAAATSAAAAAAGGGGGSSGTVVTLPPFSDLPDNLPAGSSAGYTYQPYLQENFPDPNDQQRLDFTFTGTKWAYSGGRMPELDNNNVTGALLITDGIQEDEWRDVPGMRPTYFPCGVVGRYEMWAKASNLGSSPGHAAGEGEQLIGLVLRVPDPNLEYNVVEVPLKLQNGWGYLGSAWNGSTVDSGYSRGDEIVIPAGHGQRVQFSVSEPQNMYAYIVEFSCRFIIDRAL